MISGGRDVKSLENQDFKVHFVHSSPGMHNFRKQVQITGLNAQEEQALSSWTQSQDPSEDLK